MIGFFRTLSSGVCARGKVLGVQPLTAQESLFTPLLTKYVFWNGESSAPAIQWKAEEDPRKNEKISHFFYHPDLYSCFQVKGGRGTTYADLLTNKEFDKINKH